MRFPVGRRIATALLLLAPAALGAAQEGRPRGTEDGRRMRWESLTEGERSALRKRYDQFRKLPRPDQERLRERSLGLQELRRRMEELLPPEVAERLRRLPPRERSEALRSALEAHLGERRDLLRRLVPPAEMERLKDLPPLERAGRIRRLLREAQGEIQEDWLRWGERELPPAELERLRALPPAERFSELMLLRKARTIAELEAKPEFAERLSPEQWARLKALPPRPFFAQLALLRAGLRGRPLPPLPPFLAPTPEERARLEPLPPPERRREMERLLREKIRVHLREVAGLPPEEADRIAELPREQAMAELRRLEPQLFPKLDPSSRGPR